MRFGATHAVDVTTEDQVGKALYKLTGGGADYAFDCVGLGKVTEQAWNVLKRGGMAVTVGIASAEDKIVLSAQRVAVSEKTRTGSYYGSARPQHDVPRLIGLYRAGRLKLDELITRRYSIDEAPGLLLTSRGTRRAAASFSFSSSRSRIRSGSDRGQFEGEPHGATLRSLLAEAYLRARRSMRAFCRKTSASRRATPRSRHCVINLSSSREPKPMPSGPSAPAALFPPSRPAGAHARVQRPECAPGHGCDHRWPPEPSGAPRSIRIRKSSNVGGTLRNPAKKRICRS